ncbi:uncharacterized protein RSE6_12744 [Rhynchosporium secalis]|uniref:Uncharacterized protein n=1 Tax=Rhynchosporium secalis TaxID=38038 RepID=A0A1E1MR67_RHYSE|nr:uncharacterized protein RSE6_12744 [Rhynchosporium secalis]
MAPHRSDAPQQACRPTSPLSAPITATEALTFTGDATKGFFRPVTLVKDQKLLMRYIPSTVTATKDDWAGCVHLCHECEEDGFNFNSNTVFYFQFGFSYDKFGCDE